MNTKIELEYQGVKYTLEYSRAAIKVLEQNGFRIDEFLEKPMTNIELAFQCAFIKNHPKVQVATIQEILNSCPNKDNLIVTLKQMIDETYESLLAEPEKQEDAVGNVVWKTVDLSPKKSSK